MKYYNNVRELIAHTPLVRLNRMGKARGTGGAGRKQPHRHLPDQGDRYFSKHIYG